LRSDARDDARYPRNHEEWARFPAPSNSSQM
jgi:hypothetical protein